MAIIIVLCAIILIECILIATKARKQQKDRESIDFEKEYIEIKVDTILSSATEEIMIAEAVVLQQFIGNSMRKYDMLSEKFFEVLAGVQQDDEFKLMAVYKILQVIEPISYYSSLLKNGSKYERANACRKLAEYNATDEIENIEKNLSSRDSELSYNAAMALSELGDVDSISKYVISCNENHNFSHRVVLQLLSEYKEEVNLLATLIFRECDDYIKATVIKAIAKYRFAEFEDIYLSALKSKNVTLRVAALTALGEFGDTKYEKAIVIATNDRYWIVRNAAVKALGNLNTQSAIGTVLRLISDVEWWVRYNAARTLIEMDGGLEQIEKVLKGSDNYASDALKYALYRQAQF